MRYRYMFRTPTIGLLLLIMAMAIVVACGGAEETPADTAAGSAATAGATTADATTDSAGRCGGDATGRRWRVCAHATVICGLGASHHRGPYYTSRGQCW